MKKDANINIKLLELTDLYIRVQTKRDEDYIIYKDGDVAHNKCGIVADWITVKELPPIVREGLKRCWGIDLNKWLKNNKSKYLHY